MAHTLQRHKNTKMAFPEFSHDSGISDLTKTQIEDKHGAQGGLQLMTMTDDRDGNGRVT